MPVNVRNQLGSRLVDGFQTGAKLFQLLALRPCGNVTEAVFARFNAVILADRIGNAFGLDLLGVAAFFSGDKDRLTIVRKLCHVFIVVELGMGNLMDGGAYRLHLAHTGADGDALRLGAEKSVRIPRNGLYLHRDGRSAAQRLHENLVLLHIAAQIGGKLGQGLSRSL